MAQEALTLDQAVTLARRLPARERLLLIARVAEGLVEDDHVPLRQRFPVIRGGTWPDDVPLSREHLYDDRESLT